MIAVFYIGEARFVEATRPNHARFFEQLTTISPIKIYDFTWGAWPRTCPSDLAGAIQVWDFYQALSRINETHVIKMRTDNWMTECASNAVCKETKLILTDQQDLSFMGMELVNDYDAGYLKYAAVGLPKVQDFCIVANRDKIYPSDQKMWDGNKVKKLKSGNRTYRSLIDEHTRCYTVRTHMPLLRKEYHTYNDWQITYDFVTEYHKVEAASNWWLNQQQNMAKNNQADLRYN